MKTQGWIIGLVLAGAVMLPRLATAQKFQEPTKEELQMTSDPKAPDAPAVYLYREDTTDNRNHYMSRYARIKVLTEKGKEWATVEVPYVPGFSAPPMIEARTIHPDGTVIPLQGKGEDLLAFKTNDFHLKVAVFNMPSVEVGSILEYKWTIPLSGGKVSGVAGGEGEENYYSSALASSIPEWEVQQDLFVHKEHFYWNPLTDIESNVAGNAITYIIDGERASYLLFTQRLPAGFTVTESPRQDYTLDIQNVPPFRQMVDAPPEDALRYRVHFYYTPYTTARDYWENEIKRWSRTLDQYASSTDSLKSAAAELTASAVTPEAKARKLYDVVQALDNTEFSRQKSDAERKTLHLKRELAKADDVFREKSGSANDLAGLYLALLRAAGLNADGLKVADRRRNLFDRNYLSLGQLDTLLVVLHLEGKDVFLDPGLRLCPFGQLHWAHTLTGGIQQNQKDPIVTPPNSTKDAISAHTADLAVDASGSVAGTVQLVMNGPAALHWRQLNLTADSDEVKKQVTESLQRLLPAGLTPEIAAIKGLDTPEGFLQVTAKVSGSLGSVTGKRVLLPAFLFSSPRERTFVSEDKREAPVDLHYAEQVMDEVTYRLPAGYTVEGAPQSAQLPWPEHAALVVKVTSSPNTIDVKHIFARAFVLLDAKEYPALHDYYGKLAANDQQQVVLSAPSRAGN
jgi:hypothetical protein